MRIAFRRLIVSVAVSIVAFGGMPALAGTGSYKPGTPDVIELHVAFMYDETAPQDWEPLFAEASKLLFNATEGQVRIGKVIVYNNCPQAADRADVQIHNDTAGANAHVGSLGVSGRRIRLSQTHKTVTTSGTGNRGQLGLVHEMGHHVFGLLDEYLNKNGQRTSSAYCIDQAGTDASIMDAGTTVSPENQRHEFCWSQNHRAGETRQCQRRHIGTTAYEDTDSWTWLVAYVQHAYGAALTAPASAPANSVAGHGDDPEIEYRNCGLRTVVSIDRSGSMAAATTLRALDGAGPYLGTRLATNAAGTAPIELAKQGAAAFIQLLEDIDKAAVTSFADSPTVDYAMNTMTAANKSAALSAISGLQASGSTNIGGGLNSSLQQLTGEGTAIANEVIVLLSDGMHNTGTTPDSVLPAIKARGVVVHTIGLGSVDAALMSRIASETGGTYLFANSPAGINSHYLQLLTAIRSEGVVQSEEADLTAGENRAGSVLVDQYTAAAAAEFVAVWDDPAVELGLSVRRPNGTFVAGGDPGVEVTYDPQRAFKRIRVASPPAGTWTTLIGNPAPQAVHVTLQVHSAATNVSLSGDGGGDVVHYPEPLRIRAGVTIDQAVGGAQVEAVVNRPVGPPVALRLYDDGQPSHGDDAANDGLYSNLFRAYSGDGSYTIDLRADTQGAVTVQAGEDGGEFVSQPVARAIRERSFSIVVDGMSVADHDRDGASDSQEQTAPNAGDGNGDGVPDRNQSAVASLDGPGGAMTLLAAGATCAQLSGVSAGAASPDPETFELPFGTVGFLLECSAGRAELIVHGVTALNGSVYRYGPTADNAVPHWYEFSFDGVTGAQIAGNRVILHLVDGQRGDDDLVANGVITVEQVGVGHSHAPEHVIPALSTVAALLLAAMLGALALTRLRM